MRGDSPKRLRRRAVLAGLLATLACAQPAHAQLWRERQQRRQERRERRQERMERRQDQLDGRDDPDDRWLTRRERWREVREAVRRGEIHPLRDLMGYFEAETGFEIIDVRYRKVDGNHFYGFKVLAGGGRLRWFVINAATREIMTMQEARARYR